MSVREKEDESKCENSEGVVVRRESAILQVEVMVNGGLWMS